jgi:ubiquinone/menaquinone biosynthesis C-methylase UbiE
MQIDEETEFSFISKAGVEGREILEIGCGDGRLSFRLAKAAKKLIALDPDPEKIKIAKTRTPADLAAKIRFEVGRGEKLGFATHSFDIVVYSLSFHHVERQYDALVEARRVLRPDGTLLIYEPLADGQMQRLFLLFEKEADALAEVYETIEKAGPLFSSLKKTCFSIDWTFRDSADLMDYFSKAYGEKAVMEQKDAILSIAGMPPLVLEDRLVLFEMRT